MSETSLSLVPTLSLFVVFSPFQLHGAWSPAGSKPRQSDILILCTKVLSGIQDKYNNPEHLNILSVFSTRRLWFCLFCCLVCFFTHLHIITYTVYLKCPLLLGFNTTRVGTAHLKVALTNTWATLTQKLSGFFVIFPSSPLCSLSTLESDGWFWTLEKAGVIKKTN